MTFDTVLGFLFTATFAVLLVATFQFVADALRSGDR